MSGDFIHPPTHPPHIRLSSTCPLHPTHPPPLQYIRYPFPPCPPTYPPTHPPTNPPTTHTGGASIRSLEPPPSITSFADSSTDITEAYGRDGWMGEEEEEEEEGTGCSSGPSTGVRMGEEGGAGGWKEEEEEEEEEGMGR